MKGPRPLSAGVPPELRLIVSLLCRLPTLGERTAVRFAIWLCQHADVARELGAAVSALPTLIAPCPACGHLARTGLLCALCADTRRDAQKIAVLASVQELLAVERTGKFRGRYHVMKALLDPLEGVGMDEIQPDLDALAARLTPGMELIVVFPSTSQGNTTALAIAREFSGTGVSITRIARGVPSGADLSEADAITIAQAIEGKTQP